MLNRSASLAMSTSILKALPGKLDIERHSPSILYIFDLRPKSLRSSDISVKYSRLSHDFTGADYMTTIFYVKCSDSLVIGM